MSPFLAPPLLLLLLFSTLHYASSQSSRGKSGTKSRAPTTPASKGGDLTDECPEPDGYFADGFQCDKYYECVDGVINEKLCPDGMVFNDYSPQVEKCDLPFNIDCSERPDRQTPKPSMHCPRLNGYFAHENTTVCDKFYFCVDGKFNMITCPAGLVYNERTGICTWPDEAKKKGCSSQGSWSREKRISVWPGEEREREESEEMQREARDDESSDYEEDSTSREEEEQDEEEDEEEHPVSSRRGHSPRTSENDEFFRSDSDFSNFDEEFSNFDAPPFGSDPASREAAPDYYDDNSDEFRRRQDDLLDGYIREYVEQMNKNPSETMDLSYYEKIAEAAVENSDCDGKVFQFDCPKVDVTKGQQHPRYADPQDCQFFYVCINGEVPRRNGCKLGQVFNDVTGSCDWPRNVPECKDWYKGQLTDEELYALEHPKPRTRSNSTAAANRRRPQQTRLE